MIILFLLTCLAKPVNDAQMSGAFSFCTFEYGESYSLYIMA